jgi:hypothetical protein
VLTGLAPIVNTAHLVNGALLLATSVVLALRSHWVPLAADVNRRRPAESIGAPVEAHP